MFADKVAAAGHARTTAASSATAEAIARLLPLVACAV